MLPGHTGGMRRSPLIAVALLTLAPAAQAATLYKSIGPNGTLMFSDVPPSGEATLLEQREIGSPRPQDSYTTAPMDLGQLIDGDAAVARASAQVDLAEHALAEARRGTWSPRDGIGVAPTKTTPRDLERIDYFQKGVKIARQQLLDVLRERRRG